MKKRFVSFAAATVAAAMLLTACGGSAGGATGSSKAASTAAGSSGAQAKTEIIAAIASEPNTGWDPIKGYAQKYDPILQSTLTKAFNGEITNDLATSYEVTDGGKTWTFNIREDVVFSNGDKLTAKDVAFTYSKLKEVGSSIDLTNMAKAEAASDTKVVFSLTEPDFTFLYNTAKIGIVPAALYNDSYGDNPIGSGPYKMVQWDKGQQAVWEYNDKYYGKKPAITRIVLVFMDEDAAFAAAQKGTVDIVATNQSLATQTVAGYKMVNVQTIDNYGIIFPAQMDTGKTTANGKKLGHKVLGDAAVRRAISVGMDRDKLIKDVFYGYGYPSFSMCDTLPWFNEETALNSSNSGAEVAKKILSDAGWKDSDGDGILEKNGVKAEFDLYYTSNNGNRQAIANAVSEQAKGLGIQVNPKGASNDDIQKVFHSEAYVFGRGDHTPNEYYLMTASSAAGSGWSNSGYYSNPKVDEYLKQARAAETKEDMYKYFKLAQWDGTTGASLIGDAPDAWLVRADHCFFVRDGLDIGKQPIHGHNANMQIVLNNILDWKWN
jgi:peptide/nickel transport system substrate-binding protein